MAWGKTAHVPFGERYRTSRLIFGQSLRMLRHERDLWALPILAGLAFVLLLVGGIVLTLAVVSGDSRLAALYEEGNMWKPLLGFLLILPVMYPVTVLVSVIHGAFILCLYERMEGRTCTRREAIRRSWSMLGTHARFNLVAMLVAGVFQVIGILLEKLRLVPYLGRITQTVGLFAWTVACFFVIPIIVVERERSAFGAIRQSVGLAREQWGKATAGMVTIALAVLVPYFVVMGAVLLFMFGVLGYSFLTGSDEMLGMMPAILILLFVLLGLFMLLVMPVAQAANLAYQTALYRFGRTGVVSLPYTPQTLVDAWTPYRQA